MNRTRTILRTCLLLLALSVTLAACGSSSSSSAAKPAPASSAAAPSSATGSPAVSISGYAFTPATITVAAGVKLTFTNHDQTAHTATSTSRAFDTGSLNAGQSKTIVVKTAGSYTYFCQFHAFMRGTLIVK